MPEELRFFDNLNAVNFVFVLFDFAENLNQIINMALSINSSRDCESDEFHIRRNEFAFFVIFAEHNASNFDRSYSADSV